jgi:hypothetical protein
MVNTGQRMAANITVPEGMLERFDIFDVQG